MYLSIAGLLEYTSRSLGNQQNLRLWSSGGFAGNPSYHRMVSPAFAKICVSVHNRKKLNERFDHGLYGLKPEHRFDAQHPTVNDELPNRISCGMVVVKPDIKRFTETGVEFVDGTVEGNIDVIILGTGYVFWFPVHGRWDCRSRR